MEVKMSAKCLRTAGLVLIASLAYPLTASASIIDFIWEMSGPQMIGLVLHCEYDPQFKGPYETDPQTKKDFTRADCRFVDRRFVGYTRIRTQRRFWLSVDTGIYGSTGKDSDLREYKFLKTGMLAIEPIFEIRSFDSGDGRLVIHHGVAGFSYDYLFGSGFDSFDKAAVKFRPIAFTIKQKFNVALNVRIFPNGITPDEFSMVRLEDFNRPHEYSWGLSFGYLIGK
jgi:hypothetical protein